MLETISSVNKDDAKILASLHDAINYVADRIKQNGGIVAKDRIGLLDSIADQIVTATGVGTFLGMNVPGALAEVNRSNYSKFNAEGEPIFNENMKVMKGPFYTKPDLTPYI